MNNSDQGQNVPVITWEALKSQLPSGYVFFGGPKKDWFPCGFPFKATKKGGALKKKTRPMDSGVLVGTIWPPCGANGCQRKEGSRDSAFGYGSKPWYPREHPESLLKKTTVEW